jgi:hypothetical protein
MDKEVERSIVPFQPRTDRVDLVTWDLFALLVSELISANQLNRILDDAKR